jgi:hypothetical protein
VRVQSAARVALALLLGAELIGAHQRFADRQDFFALAQRRAVALGRPLVVIGDPNGGAHTRLVPAYGCGDLTIDLTGCPSCPNGVMADITAGPVSAVADNSAVVYVSCVLEYVSDPQAAYREILRMAGSPDNVFVVSVQPWTATAALYPGARNTIERRSGELVASPVSAARKVATVGAVAGLAYLSIAPERPRGNPRRIRRRLGTS